VTSVLPMFVICSIFSAWLVLLQVTRSIPAFKNDIVSTHGVSFFRKYFIVGSPRWVRLGLLPFLESRTIRDCVSVCFLGVAGVLVGVLWCLGIVGLVPSIIVMLGLSGSGVMMDYSRSVSLSDNRENLFLHCTVQSSVLFSATLVGFETPCPLEGLLAGLIGVSTLEGPFSLTVVIFPFFATVFSPAGFFPLAGPFFLLFEGTF